MFFDFIFFVNNEFANPPKSSLVRADLKEIFVGFLLKETSHFSFSIAVNEQDVR